MLQIFKKLAAVLASFLLVIDIGKKAMLAQVFYIHYLIQFWKDNSKTWALLNSESKINAMNLAYAKKLGL